ncbi:MAG: PfkB family carbohydrate kinase [Verrucomicrobiae bacterium]|nr:PfkB family carbohydrate kinase [Verrucomicrobiae bacterium]
MPANSHFAFDLIGLGYCGLDHICLMPSIPQDDKVEILEHLVQGGGPAATATVAAARLGMRTAFLGVVGDDPSGAAIVKGLEMEGVNTQSLRVCSDTRSPAAYCWVESGNGKRGIGWTRGTVGSLQPASLKIELLQSVRLLHLDGHHMAAAAHAARIAKSGGATVSLDAGSFLDGIEDLMKLADLLVVSSSFADRFLGRLPPARQVEKLMSHGARIAAVTLGSEGVCAASREGILQRRAFAVQAVDTTGAGDVFHGALAYACLQNWPLARMIDFSSAAAAIKCLKLGGRTGIPTRTEVERFLEERKNEPR